MTLRQTRFIGFGFKLTKQEIAIVQSFGDKDTLVLPDVPFNPTEVSKAISSLLAKKVINSHRPWRLTKLGKRLAKSIEANYVN